jgi:inhibitor of KinA sporulation pathway (predicted exonuclease)
MKIAVVDVEATCWDTPAELAKNKNEVIEIGYSIIENEKIVSSGDIYVKPTHSTVSSFCERLTGITQKHLDEVGLPPKEAYAKLNSIFSGCDEWASYGNYDKSILRSMETMENVKINMPPIHHNIREVFSQKIKKTDDPKASPSNPKLSMEELGMRFVGRNHNGKDDAYNIALLYIKLMGLKNTSS